jgi:hypothetical protein
MFLFGFFFFSLKNTYFCSKMKKMETAGIKYTKSPKGNNYVRVDLDMYGENQLLEDFLDWIDIEASMNEPKRPLRDIIIEQNQKRGINV